MTEMRICVITVAWNCRDQILALVASVLAQGWSGLEVVVVDNASTDGTSEAIAKMHPEVRILRNQENHGGAGGFSDGIRAAWSGCHDAYWLLDGDAQADAGALAPLVSALTHDPSAGAACSQIAVFGQPDLVQEEGAGIDPVRGLGWTLRSGQSVDRNRQPYTVGYGAACSLLIRRTALAACGPFRDDLFVFFDDIEWCVRARACGWQILAVPASVVFHPPHANKPLQPWRLYYSLRNHLELMYCHGTGLVALGYRWRRCCETAMRSIHLSIDGEAALAAATAAALSDVASGHLGRRDGLAPIDVAPVGWSASDPALWPDGRALIVPDLHPGESTSMISALSSLLGDRPVTVLTDPSHVVPSAWQRRDIPARGLARRQAIRAELAKLGVIAVFGRCESDVPHQWIALRWSRGMAWTRSAGRPWPAPGTLKRLWFVLQALAIGSWACLRLSLRSKKQVPKLPQ